MKGNGKGKGRATTVADEDDNDNDNEGREGVVRDTKFYAFYDEIIPKVGGGRRGGYGL